MKRIGFIICMCALFNFAAFSQDNNSDNSSTDDVYYQGDDDQNAPPPDQAPQDQSQDNGPVDYQTFYDQLSPYGQWVNTPEYGNVWVPNNQTGFTPYLTNGHWVYTEYGWTWVSDDPWGWGPYHYGRWYDDAVEGWCWVPGYDWAPAWVTWGDYGDYYCWAPIWPGVVVGPHYRPDPRFWCFVPHDRINYGRPVDVVVRPEVAYRGSIGELNAHINFISHANTFHQSVFFAGPKPAEVEHYTHAKIAPVKIANTNKPEQTRVAGNQVTMYRPAVTRTNKQPAPKNVRPAQAQPAQQQRSNPTETHTNTVQQRTTPTETRSSWTPPRQNTQPARQAPVQTTQPARQAPVQTTQPVRNNFIPSSHPAPVMRSAPSPAPSRPSFGGGGGGGMRSGGGGGRR